MTIVRIVASWLTATGLLLPAGCDSNSADDQGMDDDDDGGEDDDPSDDGSDPDPDDDGGEMQACHEAVRHGPLALDEPCASNSECQSAFCDYYETFGPDAGGHCSELPPDCLNRSMGNLKDVVTDTPIVGATMFFGPATEMVVNPNTATRLAQSTTDANGHFDMTTSEPVDSFYAVLGGSTADGYETTVGFLGFPIDQDNHYEPAFGVRDFFAVSLADLAAWNEALADDEEVAPYLPIEDKGGVVTVVASYDVEEKRVPGVTVTPADEASPVVIRYLDENGTTFTSQATSSNGVVVLLGAESGELFDANSEDMRIWDPDRGRPGVVSNGVYEMLILMVPR